MLINDKLDASTKWKDNIDCVVDLNITENGRNETKLIETRIVEFFNIVTKHISYEDRKVILNGILSDPSIKDIIDLDDLNGNVTNVLVNNLRKTLFGMSKYENALV